MSGDYTWDQMPEELAHQLYSFSQATNLKFEAAEFQEWLLNEMQHCAATKESWPRLHSVCPDLPVPGSEFCHRHMPKEDVDDSPEPD